MTISENLPETVNFVNHALAGFGLPPVDVDFNGDSQLLKSKEGSQILSVLMSTIQVLQGKSQYVGDLESRLARIYSDYEAVKASSDKLKQKLEQTDRQLFDCRVKSDNLESQLADLSHDNQKAKEEARQAKSALLYAKNQHLHEIRKKERENEKTKTALQRQSQQEASRAGKMSFKVIGMHPSLLNGSSSSNNLSPASATELLEDALENNEVREKLLIQENLLLRQSLYETYVSIQSFIAESVEPKLQQSSLQKAEIKAKFFLPFDEVADQIDLVLKESVDALEERLGRLRLTDSTTEHSTHEISIYKNQIEECRKVIREQQKLIEKTLTVDFSNSEAGANNAAMQKAQKILTEERDYVKRQRQQLDEERKQFTAAAVKLGRERSAFEQEKHEFEDEKRLLETQHILKDLPATPNWLKQSVRKGITDFNSPAPPPLSNKPNNSFSPFSAQVSRISSAVMTPSFAKTIHTNVQASPVIVVDDNDMNELNRYLQQSLIENTPEPPKPLVNKRSPTKDMNNTPLSSRYQVPAISEDKENDARYQ